MYKKIDRKTYKQAFNELQYKAHEISEGNINVFEKNREMHKPVELGVNWCALGTVSSDKAVQFANDMIKVANLVKNFKYNGYIVEY